MNDGLSKQEREHLLRLLEEERQQFHTMTSREIWNRNVQLKRKLEGDLKGG